MNITTIENKTVITLKEICDILEVRHDKSMIKIVELAKEPSFGQLSILDICIPKGNGATQTIKTYSLTKMQAIAVGSKLNNALLMKLVMKLEKVNTPALPKTYKEALLELIEKEEQLENAIKTKAYISDKKTATALNTASQKSKQVKKPEIELDKSKDYSTIKRMTMLNHGIKFDWRILKSIDKEMEVDTISVFDYNYGSVKSYHKFVWLEDYALEIK